MAQYAAYFNRRFAGSRECAGSVEGGTFRAAIGPHASGGRTSEAFPILGLPAAGAPTRFNGSLPNRFASLFLALGLRQIAHCDFTLGIRLARASQLGRLLGDALARHALTPFI